MFINFKPSLDTSTSVLPCSVPLIIRHETAIIGRASKLAKKTFRPQCMSRAASHPKAGIATIAATDVPLTRPIILER